MKEITNTEVVAYVAKVLPWQQDALGRLHEAITRAIPSATEAIQYGKPHYTSGGEIVAALHVAAAKVSLLILNAEAVPAEKGFTRSLGDGSRKVVDITEGQEVDVDRIVATLLATRPKHEGEPE